MKTPNLPTLEDVAREAHVSTATVSRCLNLPDKVTEKTQKRVMAAVNLLGYSPNFGAQALAAKRTNTIGAVVPTLENAIFARGLQAFQEEVTRNGATLLVASSSYQQKLEEEQIRSLVARGADALLLIGDNRSEEIYTFLKKRGVPWVIAWNFQDGSEHCFVGFDNRSSAKEITDKAINLGHTRIAMIAGMTRGNDRARDRLRGVEDAIIEGGLPIDSFNVIEAQYSFADGGDAMEALLQNEPRPTVVICGNDILAVGAIKRLKSLGLNVPEDISITGFDDIAVASVIEPELTTVHVPHRAMGTKAAESLLKMIEQDDPVESQQLDTFIAERQSLTSPPKG
ncbi:LacI family transcriptional regulator [Rhodobacterales bacterium 52_120_T64]|nr:LacI family transcriptional regulator [Rhodobacterales bacterium 52_120_T64]